MEKNCLFTKLKGTVDNDKLIPYGWIEIPVVSIPNDELSRDDQAKLDIYAKHGKEITVKALDGGYFGTAPDTIESEHKTTITGGHLTLYFKNDNYRVRISGKYGDITSYNSQTQGSSTLKTLFDNTPIGVFNYLSSPVIGVQGRFVGSSKDLGNVLPLITSYVLWNGSKNLEVDLTDFEVNTHITSVQLNNVLNITGSFDSIGKIPSVMEISADKAVGLGTLEGFVNQRIAHGQASVTESSPLNWTYVLQNVTFGGSRHNCGFAYVTWESSSKIAVYEGANRIENYKRIYCKGYTQQEAEAKWPGKTIVRVDA
jgi:hypothetical protein